MPDRVADAANNYQSGPIATAFQLALVPPLLVVLLPIALAMNLFAWVRTYAFGGGVHAAALRKTLPTNSGYRTIASIVKVENALELEERVLDPAKCEDLFWRYVDLNGFARDEVAFESRRIAADRTKLSVYREIFYEDTPAKVKLFVLVSPRHTVLCGLYDFGYLDGTSCLNFLKGFLAAYFDDEMPLNRPLEGRPLDLVLSERVRPRLGAGDALRVAVQESWNFAMGWSRWSLSREAYDLFVPPQISLAIETIEPEQHAAMIAALSALPEPVKPFEHFMSTSAAVMADCGLRDSVRLLTQVSCQARYYEPELPRDQVGYWLIGRSTWQTLAEMRTVAFCRSYYQNLQRELADFDGGIRDALLRQVMLGFGGTGAASNLREIFWFNNYGMREMTPSAGRITYHWAPNHKLCTAALINLVTINGSTCITLSSTVLSQAKTEQAAREMKRRLLAEVGVEPARVGRAATVDRVGVGGG